MTREAISKALRLIFQAIENFKAAFPNRAFTIDGRLVGDVGEVIAALEYDLALDDVMRATHDAKTPDGRRVQIKATFKDSLSFKTYRTCTWASSCIQMADTKRPSTALGPHCR